MKKIFCLILSLIILLSFNACGSKGEVENTTTDASQEETTQQTEETTKAYSKESASFTLPYSRSDTFNPYKAKTQINRAITTLLYDSLYTLDEKFLPIEIVAESADIKKDSVTVSLKKSVKFSDLSSLNASDVVYSFDQAKESKRYKKQLDHISGASAIDKFKVKFTLSQPDAFILNVLTFPIIEYGSVGKEVPLGSGRYIFSSEKLSYNKNHISGKKPEIKNIGLCSLNEKTNFVDALQIGNISFVFRDLSDCDIQRAVAQYIPVTLNNLVYVGINGKKDQLKDAALRRAINMAIDKEDIVSQDFHGYAVRTESPFNPLWEQTSDLKSIFDQSEAVNLLEKSGYTYGSDEDKFRKDKNGKILSLKILVCSDNTFRTDAAESIAKNLSQIGINAQISTLSYSKYKDAVKDGKFDLYIGETKLCENMDISPFFSKDGVLNSGIDLQSDIVASYDEMLKKEKSVSEFESEFLKQLPFIPICYRQGIAMTSNTLSGDIKCIQTDVFSNISDWKMN